MPVNRKPTLMDHTIALREEVKALRQELRRKSNTDNDEEIASVVAEVVASVGSFQGFGTDQAPHS